jgi:acetyl-CoA carboxylase biotin carboxyl carrier protein
VLFLGSAPTVAKRPLKRPAKTIKPGRAGADTSSVELLGGTGMADLRQLIQLVQKTGIGELEVSSGGRTVRISASPATVVMGAAPVAAEPRAAASAAKADAATAADPAKSAAASSTQLAITSPMVGTYYRAPAPDADAYIEVGDVVSVGQTVCIVEAMKLMNEIESEVRGRIVQILVENAQPVEFGQRLFLVEPV